MHNGDIETLRDRAYRLAAAARADYRSARKFMMGGSVRGVAGERLAIAARELGLRPEAGNSEPPRAA